MLPPELKVFLVAMSPVIELRGAIPLALKVYGLPWWSAYLLSVSGNLVPLTGIVFLAKPVSSFLSDNSLLFKKFFLWLFGRVRKKTEKLKGLSGEMLVLVLTAIPVPLVGGWTGALAAFLLEVPFKKALRAVVLGALISGLVVSFLSWGLIKSL